MPAALGGVGESASTCREKALAARVAVLDGELLELDGGVGEDLIVVVVVNVSYVKNATQIGYTDQTRHIPAKCKAGHTLLEPDENRTGDLFGISSL